MNVIARKCPGPVSWGSLSVPHLTLTHFLFPLAVVLCLSLGVAHSQPPAFPGAEGFGAKTPGGRGGRVIKVTNLNDSGPGSFRDALTASGPRIVVFETGGNISLRSEIIVTQPFLTIAGQTAPGEGVCVEGYPVRVSTHDLIIRGIRFRSGDKNADRKNKQSNLRFESLHILGRNRTPVYNLIVDHCSISWGIDKNLGVWAREEGFGFALHDITIQWCISSEALFSPLHPKGAHHAMGMFFSAVKNVSAHHNLIAHCNARNPQFSKSTEGEAINNVVYNWGTFATEIQGGAKVNVIGNYYRPGKDWTRNVKGITVEGSRQKSSLYVKGNVGPGREEDEGDDWNAVKGDPALRSMSPVIPLSGVRTQSAKEAYALVLAHAGALPRDPVDSRVIADIAKESGKGIASQDDIGGWPLLSTERGPRDSDEDGMPDSWESSHGLNPMDESDGTGDMNGDGYTNIEEYINGLIPQPEGIRN